MNTTTEHTTEKGTKHDDAMGNCRNADHSVRNRRLRGGAVMAGLAEAAVLAVSMVGGYIALHRRFMNGPADEPWPGMTWREWNTAQPPF